MRIVVASIERRRVYVDTDAAISIMYHSCFKKMRLDPSNLKPYAPLHSFTQGKLQPKGIIQLPTKIGPYPQQRTTMMSFYVVDFSSAYNVIIG